MMHKKKSCLAKLHITGKAFAKADERAPEMVHFPMEACVS
jgi:hypothetical protein